MATYGPFGLEDLADNETVDVLVLDDNFKKLSSGATQPDTAGSPSTEAMGDAAARGVAPTAARADHRHGMPGFGSPTTQAFADTPQDGTSAALARADHRHGMPAGAEALSYGRKVVQSGDLTGGAYTVPSNVTWVFTQVSCTVVFPNPATTAREIYVCAVAGNALLAATGGSTVVGGSYNTITGAVLAPTQLSQGDSSTYRSDGSNWRN